LVVVGLTGIRRAALIIRIAAGAVIVLPVIGRIGSPVFGAVLRIAGRAQLRRRRVGSALAGRLRQAMADEELESTLTSVRDRVGVAVKAGALDVRRDEGPAQQAPAPQPRGKF